MIRLDYISFIINKEKYNNVISELYLVQIMHIELDIFY